MLVVESCIWNLHVTAAGEAYLAPSKPAKIPAASSPENAVASTRPEYRIAVLNASSFLVYQHDSM